MLHAIQHAIESSDPRAAEIHADVQVLTKETQAHSWRSKIGKHLHQRIRAGDAPAFLLSQKELNAANGVKHEYHLAATMMLSQYVHTLPMSVQQLVEFQADTPQARNMSALPIQYSMGFLTRAITRMRAAFPHGRPALTAQQSRIFESWKTVIENGVRVPTAPTQG
ncbi:hypothetical protein CAL29_07225 [Bordetella genomosp. 10]|uniref:Uncharacterized protein n=1 Tax=Bordetella genomosp. 10 TaxID=1416804 RepID=A0A261SMC0_9BORD|nr:hypothetical protein [Bordetella genomosp. 10]OZI38127.1 hypothetical protein CAL29_07225 [Bordetella genomosp. 10]